MVVEAQHQGLAAHQMAGYDENKVRKALGFGDSHKVVVVIALGYEKKINAEDITDEKLKERFLEKRTRKEISENFFFEKVNK